MIHLLTFMSGYIFNMLVLMIDKNVLDLEHLAATVKMSASFFGHGALNALSALSSGAVDFCFIFLQNVIAFKMVAVCVYNCTCTYTQT